MKFFNKRFLTASLTAAVAAFVPWQGAIAASGQTNVSIDFPDIIILHYISDLTLTFTGDLDTQTDESSGSDSAALATTVTFDANTTPTAAGATDLPDSVAVTVTNVWAVRGITSSGQIRVTPSIDTAAATVDGSTTTMSMLQVKTAAVAAGDPIDCDAPGFPLANAVLGDIVFDLDVSAVTVAKSHSGMQYTIMASATP